MIKLGKDRDPKDTVNIVKNILSSLGIEFTTVVSALTDNLYQVDLIDKTTDWIVHGKGVSRDLAMASAYGEAIERLQNLFLGNFPIFEFENCNDSKVIDNLDIKSIPNKLLPCDGEVGLPFYNVFENKTVYLPIKKILYYQGSTGMSSGNTPEEAIVQGLSEILERWSLSIVCENQLTPPEIPRIYIESNYPNQYKLIEEIETISKCKIKVYDMSLGKDIPSVGIIIIDTKTQMYKESFGSHPFFEIALERCLTESVQNSSFFENYQKLASLTPWSDNNQKNHDTPFAKAARFNSHNGPLPDSFFKSNPSWKFKPWNCNFSSNKDSLDFLLKIVKSLNKGLYIRNSSWTGYPTYLIYSPDFSEIGLPSKDGLKTKKDFDSKIQNKQMSNSDRLDLIYRLKTRSLADSNTWNNWETDDAILAALYLDNNQLDKAIESLFDISNYDSYYRAVLRELELRQNGVEIQDRDHMILTFFDDDHLDYVKSFWRSNDTFYSLLEDRPFTFKQHRISQIYLFSYKLYEEIEAPGEYSKDPTSEELRNNKIQMYNFLKEIVKSYNIDYQNLKSLF